MKRFHLNGVDVVFWNESNTLFFRVYIKNEIVSELYCCGNRPFPETDKEALELTKIGWVW